MDVVQRLGEIQSHLSACFFEREEVIEGCLVALGCREHLLMLGPPGTAKSQLIMALTRMVSGACLFQWQLTRFSTPEELFGPVSLRGLQEDRYRRVTDGLLPEAHVAYIDEVFKAGPANLNLMLSIMNERLFYNDGRPQRCNLISLFGASNEVPQGDEETALAAFADRFLLRFEVDYLQEDGNFVKLLSSNGRLAQAPPVTVTLDELRAFHAVVDRVAIGDDVFEALRNLRRELKNEGVVASDRRWCQSLRALQAKAALAGDGRVVVERDFDILSHILWPDPSKKKLVSKVVRRVADPLAERVMEIQEEAREIHRAALEGSNKASAGSEAVRKFKSLVEELESVKARCSAGTRSKAQRALEQIQAFNQEVLLKCLGVDLAALSKRGG